jgi:hypothetical protein
LGETGDPAAALTIVKRVELARPEMGRPCILEELILEKAGRGTEATRAFQEAEAFGAAHSVAPSDYIFALVAGS